MSTEFPWQGSIVSIFIAPQGGAPMQGLEVAELIEGVGIAGDRYATGKGHYSSMPSSDRQITLIEAEALEAIARDYDLQLGADESRRNVCTRGVPLNHLVGREFRLGDAVLYGARLNVPCKYLEKVTGKKVFESLKHRSGLNCEIRHGALVKPGDLIRPV